MGQADDEIPNGIKEEEGDEDADEDPANGEE
jgi:hypothetical protein